MTAKALQRRSLFGQLRTFSDLVRRNLSVFLRTIYFLFTVVAMLSCSPLVTSNDESSMNTPIVLTDITHYQDVITALQSIERASSNELAKLLTQMTADSYKNPYSKAFNTAIFQRWAEVDIDDAIERTILSIDDKFNHTGWRYDGLRILASIQPDLLLSKAENVIDRNIKHPIYQGISANNPEKFARYALSLAQREGEYSGDDWWLPMAVFEWADSDPTAAYEWVQAEATDELQSTDLSPLMWKWFEKDPDNAIVEIERLLNSSETTDPADLYRYSEMYSNHIAQSDPAAAYRWVRKQDDPEIRDNMMTMVLHMWSESDPDALRDFISKLNQKEQSIIRRYL